MEKHSKARLEVSKSNYAFYALKWMYCGVQTPCLWSRTAKEDRVPPQGAHGVSMRQKYEKVRNIQKELSRVFSNNTLQKLRKQDQIWPVKHVHTRLQILWDAT